MRAVMRVVLIGLMALFDPAAAQSPAPAAPATPAAAPVTAGGQTLPPFDLLVFLDRSKTIFTNAGAGAPNERVAQMLKTVFERRIDEDRRPFITAGDRLYLYTFGTNVQSIAERVDGGNPAALQQALDRFGSGVIPDEKTDFSALMASVAQNSVLTTHDDRLKLVLIASDFVDDPFNASRRKDKDRLGVCDLLDKPKKTRLEPDVEKLKTAFAQAVNAAGWRPYLGLLSVEPKEKDFPGARLIADNPDNYLNCVLQTVAAAPVQSLLEDQLEAGRIRYDEVVNDADAFAQRFVTDIFRATLPKLMVESGACRPRRQQMECTLNLRNNARVSNTVTKVGFFADERAATPLVELPVNTSIPPGQPLVLTLPIPAADAARLPAARVSVALEDQGVGKAARTTIPISALTPPSLEQVEATRALTSDPLRLTVTVKNTGGDRLVPRAMLFYDAQSGGAFLGEVPAADALPIAPAGQGRAAAVLPDAVQGRLLAGTDLYMALRLDAAEMETSVSTPRVRVPSPRFQPLDITQAAILPVEGSTDQFDLQLAVGNPGTAPRRVVEVQLFAGANAPRPSAVVKDAGGGDIPAGTTQTLTLRLPPVVIPLLSSGLFAAVVDSQSGKASQPYNAGQAPATAPLEITKAALHSNNAEAGVFTLEVSARNPGVTVNTLASLILYYSETGEEFRREVPDRGPVTINPGATVSLTITLREVNDRRFLEAERQVIGCMDQSGKFCSARSNVQHNLSRASLLIQSQEWVQGTDGQSALMLILRNPSDITVTLAGVSVDRDGRNEVPLPLRDPINIPPRGKETTVPVTYPDGLWQQMHPRDDVYLSLKCREVDCTRARERLLPVVDAALITVPEPGSWDTSGLPAVTIGVRNHLKFQQPIREIWAALDATGREARRLTNFDRAARPVIPPNDKVQTVAVRFPEDSFQPYLTGDDRVYLCVVGMYDRNVAQSPFRCGQPWIDVPLPERTPLKTIVPETGGFTGNKVSVIARNEGGLPQEVTEVAFDFQNGLPPVREPLDRPVLVPPRGAMAVSLTLPADKADALRRAFEVKALAVGYHPPGWSLTDALRRSDTPLLVTNSYRVALSEAMKHEVYGSDGRINVKATVSVSRSQGGTAPPRQLHLWLTDAAGQEIGNDRTITVAFQEASATYHPVWVLQPSDSHGKPMIVHAEVEGAPNAGGRATLAIQGDENRESMDQLRWFFFPLSLFLLLLSILSRYGVLKWSHIPFTFRFGIKIDALERYSTIINNVVSITSIFGAFAFLPGFIPYLKDNVLLVVNFGSSWFGLVLVNMAIAGIIAAAMFFGMFVIVKSQALKIIADGRNIIEYPVLVSNKISTITRWIIMLSIFALIFLVFVWFVFLGPYEAGVGIHLINV